MFNSRNLIIGSIVFVAVVLMAILWPTSEDSVTRVRPQKQQAAGQEKNVPVQQEASAQKKNKSAELIFQKARQLEKTGDLLQAKAHYQKIFEAHPDYSDIEKVQQRIEKINMNIIYSNTPTENSVIHEVVRGDTLGELAGKYGTTIDLIKQNNNLDSDVIRIGQKLRIWKEPFKIHVDKSQNVLTLKTRGDVIKVYHVSTGSNSSTPVGEFSITSKLKDPVWFNKGVIVPPESPANVLGTRWLGFDIPGYGIHGTIDPDKIGQQVTAGCVRMRNEEVEELYSIIPIGTKVTVTN